MKLPSGIFMWWPSLMRDFRSARKAEHAPFITLWFSALPVQPKKIKINFCEPSLASKVNVFWIWNEGKTTTDFSAWHQAYVLVALMIKIVLLIQSSLVAPCIIHKCAQHWLCDGKYSASLMAEIIEYQRAGVLTIDRTVLGETWRYISVPVGLRCK